MGLEQCLRHSLALLKPNLPAGASEDAFCKLIFQVRPVVLYPGWFITRQPKDAEVWVLNPRSLWKFLEHCPTSLNPVEIRMIAKHISRYQRACEEQK